MGLPVGSIGKINRLWPLNRDCVMFAKKSCARAMLCISKTKSRGIAADLGVMHQTLERVDCRFCNAAARTYIMCYVGTSIL